MNKSDERNFYALINRAYIVDGNNTHTGEAVLLACLLHAKGKGRESKDMTEVLKMMKDKNVESGE